MHRKNNTPYACCIAGTVSVRCTCVARPLADWRHMAVEPIAGGGCVVEAGVPGASGWSVAAVFLRREEGLVVAELTVFPDVGNEARVRRAARRQPLGRWSRKSSALDDSSSGGVTVRLLRQVPLPDLVAEAHAWFAQEAERADRRSGRGQTWALDLTAEPARPGRAGRSDRYYAEWAARYAEKVAAGSPAPIVELAAEHDLGRGQVRDLIHKARERDLLPRGLKGRAGGVLTERARALLAEPAPPPKEST